MAWGGVWAGPNTTGWGAKSRTGGWGLPAPQVTRTTSAPLGPIVRSQMPAPNVNTPSGDAANRYFNPPPDTNTSAHHNPSPYGVDTSKPGYMMTPGTGEQWWAANQDRINAPGKMGSFLEGAAGRLFGMDYQPTGTGAAYDKMSRDLAGPGQGTENAWGVSGQLKNRTGGEDIMGRAADMFGGPNLAHDYATDTSGFFKAPTNTQQFRDQFGNTIAGPGSGETYVNRMLESPTYVGSELGNFMPGLRDKSYSENLYESGNQGLNKFYDREMQKQSRALTNRLAASGMFGSGQTVRGLEELGADLGASQARDMASLADQADRARLGRTGAALDFARGASDEVLGRADRGLASDRLGLDRTRLGLDMSTAADDTSLKRIMGGADVAKSGDDSLFRQGEDLGKLGKDMSDTEINRLTESGKLGLDADAENRQRAKDLFGASVDYDTLKQKAADLGIRVEDLLGKYTEESDLLDWQKTQGAFGMAQDVQNMFEGRNRDALDSTIKLGGAKANVVEHGTDAANDEQYKATVEYIQNLVATGQISKEQGDQFLEELGQGIGLGIQGAKVITGGGK